jgi:hypothetical protein
MTTNKLVDTFLLDLENLSDSDNDQKRIPIKNEAKDIKSELFSKKNPCLSTNIISTASTKILELARKEITNNNDYKIFKEKLINDEKLNVHIIPVSLTKEDKM